MTDADGPPHPSLVRRIFVRVGLVALFASVIQLLVISATHYFDYDHLALDHVRYEAQWLANGVKIAANEASFTLPPGMHHYTDEHRGGYAFRVLDAKGRVLGAHQAPVFDRLSPWQPSTDEAMPRSWFRKLDNDRRFFFAGGQQFRIGEEYVLVEVATFGDPRAVHRWIVAYETLEDIWLPTLPFTLLIPIATLLLVRSELNFLNQAAQQAERVDPARPVERLAFAGIPSEAAPFASAINRLLHRVSALLQSHRVFLGSAAHELRTPLAAMLLELEKIDDPRARLLEKDVLSMSESVGRLLTLVRLQASDSPDLVDVDLGAVVWDTVNALGQWARTKDHQLELRLEEAGTVRGDPIAIREAVRNLVENAVKHTPAGTPICVSVAADGTITVEDGGPGFPVQDWDQFSEPFRRGTGRVDGAGLGLSIVRQAINLHQGSIQVGRSALGGAKFQLRFA
jgi:two-component system, OmpR family, sensor histidine kinase QseC